MTTSYLTIMMKHFEQMNFEVVAAAETVLDASLARGREDTYECHRFLFVKEGEGKLIVQDKVIPLVEGSLCILLSGMSHRIEVEPQVKLILQWCHFRTSHEVRDIYKTLGIPFYIQLSPEHEISALFHRLSEQLALDKITSRLKIKAAMLELISIYLDHLSLDDDHSAPTEELQKIEIILQYIDNHVADNITVEDLAKQVYLHPNYFIVFFKGIIGYSPIQYVNLRRMEISKRLLLKPDSNVSAVASKVGMQNYYFSRMFKVHTGLTPSRYRKQAAANLLTSDDQSYRDEGNRSEDGRE